jgi:hypothetical protein
LRKGLVTPAEHWFARSIGLVRRTRRRLLLAMRSRQTGIAS